MKVKTSPLLKQCEHVYTPLIFELFQDEWEGTFAAYVKNHTKIDGLGEYLVAFIGQKREYKVTSNKSEEEISCSCKLF